jgi:basic amino acid/polyamine antiporter, APA family
MASDPPVAVVPRRSLSLVDACALIVGIMLGAGIFRAPAIVAAQVSSETLFMLLWVTGGLISLAGALCYAELASRFPHAGGEYHFLRRAYGDGLAFLFAWSRMSVVQTGAIAAIAFVFGDYAARLAPLGPNGPALYAAGVVAAVTALNALGTVHGKRLQNGLAFALAVAIVVIVAGGLVADPARTPLPASGAAEPVFALSGLAVIFVMLTYGGWNEAAYLGADLKEGRRTIVRAFVIGIVTVMLIYLAMNFAYLRVLGLEGLRGSRAPAADLVQAVFGPANAALVSALVMVACAATVNATVFTGARTNYAFGCDQRLFAFLGRWHAGVNAPLYGLMWQGSIALVMIAAASVSRDGFETLVVYTAPAFWLFFLLNGLALFVLRRRVPAEGSHFRVPLFPLTPLVFCAACAGMFVACVRHALSVDAGGGFGARLGLGVLLLGIPLMLLSRRMAAGVPAQQRAGG